MHAIQELVDYVNDRHKGECLRREAEELGLRTFHVLAHNVVVWIKDQYCLDETEPLSLNMDCWWCREVETLTQPDTLLGKWLHVTQQGLDFRPEISNHDRQRVRELVHAQFKPTIHVTFKCRGKTDSS